MLRRLIEARMLIAMAIAAGVGTVRTARVPHRRATRCFSRSSKPRRPDIVPRARLRLCAALVLHTVLRSRP